MSQGKLTPLIEALESKISFKYEIILLVLALFMVKHGDAFLFVKSMLVMYIVWYSRQIPYQHNIHNIIHTHNT